MLYSDYFSHDSMTLINTLLLHAAESHWEELSAELERLNVRRAVIVGFISYPASLSVFG